MGFLPYAASDVLRNRRRTVSAILGVLLAVTFVAGTFIAIDSSARATLDASLTGIPGDFSFYLSSTNSSYNYSALEAALLDSPGILDASLYRSVQVSWIENTTGSTNFSYRLPMYAIDPEHPPSILSGVTASPSLDLPPRSVGLPKEYADAIHAGIGDRVVAVNQVNETTQWTANLTVAALLEKPSTVAYPQTCPIDYCFPFTPAILHLRDVSWLLTQLNVSDRYGYQIIGEVWIDRAHYVNPYEIDATERSLLRIQRRLQEIIGPGASLNNNVVPRLQGFSNLLAAERILYLLLSMPVVLLGVYLGAVGVDLSHAERRRELAVLKTRGARRGQVIGLLILEAVVGGLIAAVIGLAAGTLLSRFLLGVVNPYATPTRYESFILTTDTVLTVAFLAIVLMAAVAYRSAKRTASLPIVETLRYYAPGETKIQYSPKVDVALVTAGLADYVLVWWRGGAPTNLWTFLLGVVPFLLLPVVPLLLIVGLTRLLTRSTGKIYDWFARAAKPFTKELYYIIRRNLTRNPRRSSNVAIIIALGLAFGVFTLSIIATNAAHLEREVRADIGADMAVTPLDPSRDLTANLSAIPGVVGVTTVQRVDVFLGYGATVYALDPDSYFGVSQPEGWYFADGNAAHGHEVLAKDGQVLVSQAFFDQSALEVGDRLHLFADRHDPSNGSYLGTIRENVTVGGVVSFLPGVNSPGNLLSGPYGSYRWAVYAGLGTMQPFLDPTVENFGTVERYLVDLAPGADWRAAKTAAAAKSNVGSVSVTAEQVELQNASPFVRALSGFIGMEIAFIVIILTAGVGLILYAASLERDVEFAAIIARGSSRWQTAQLLVGEAFVIILVGLTIGVGVGLGTSFIATQWLATGPGGVPTSPVPYFFVFPLDALLLVLLAPAAMLFAAFLVSVRTAHMNLAKVLKLRGG